MHQQTGALDVPEKLRAQARTGVSTFNQAGDIGDDEAFLVRRIAYDYDAEVRLQGGERIIRDLGRRCGNARDQRGLANIRITHKPYVSQQLEFEAKVALLARASVFVLARRAVHRRGKSRVAAPAASTLRDDDAFVRSREIMHFLAGVVVVQNRSDGNFQQNVFAFAPGLVGTFAVASTLSLVLWIEAEMHQRVMALAGFHNDVATVTAVAAGGPATRDKFLPPKGNATVAAVAGFDANFRFIDEHELSHQLSAISYQLSEKINGLARESSFMTNKKPGPRAGVLLR